MAAALAGPLSASLSTYSSSYNESMYAEWVVPPAPLRDFPYQTYIPSPSHCKMQRASLQEKAMLQSCHLPFSNGPCERITPYMQYPETYNLARVKNVQPSRRRTNLRFEKKNEMAPSNKEAEKN